VLHAKKGGLVATNHQSVLKLITYLASQPTMDRLAQFLVLEALHDYGSRGALISKFDNDGRVHAMGSFGFANHVVRGMQHLSLWDRAPFVDVIRDGAPLFFSDGAAIEMQYPWLAKQDELLLPTVAWPLALGEERLGALQIQFSAAPDEGKLASHLASLAPVIALYVGFLNGDHEPIQPSPNGHARLQEVSDGPLTDRQKTILRMLAAGMTNPQIAARIGFSDSTVRQETMAIYRHLGATGRRDAARIAAMRGLLEESHVGLPALTGPS
jgi:DNA-binding CsgD family transcriptional regulator